MSVYRQKVVRKLISLSIAIAIAGSRSFAFSTCEDHVFSGFDGRLKATAIGAVELGGNPVVGFEVVHGSPVVALPHRIVTLNPSGVESWISPDEIIHIGTDGHDRLTIQTRSSIVKRTPGGAVEPDLALRMALKGQISNSGNDNVLDVVKNGPESWTVSAIRSDGSHGPSLQLKDQVRALSWNQSGLSLVSGSALIIQASGSKRPVLVAADEGFKQAQDSCLAGNDRVVLALSNVVLLFTPQTGDILAGMSALVRCAGDVVYMLDLQTGIVARVSGLGQIGNKEQDRIYAEKIARQLPFTVGEDDSRFLEAARIIGCSAVRRVRIKEDP